MRKINKPIMYFYDTVVVDFLMCIFLGICFSTHCYLEMKLHMMHVSVISLYMLNIVNIVRVTKFLGKNNCTETFYC